MLNRDCSKYQLNRRMVKILTVPQSLTVKNDSQVVFLYMPGKIKVLDSITGEITIKQCKQDKKLIEYKFNKK
jgi:hypothetical protein